MAGIEVSLVTLNQKKKKDKLFSKFEVQKFHHIFQVHVLNTFILHTTDNTQKNHIYYQESHIYSVKLQTYNI